jgi:putative ABC transport system ATP-binding protein
MSKLASFVSSVKLTLTFLWHFNYCLASLPIGLSFTARVPACRTYLRSAISQTHPIGDVVMTGSPGLDPERLVVRAEGVSKTYRRGGTAVRVLERVNLNVERGRCVFLAGPSGSGKTTLLSILGCILSADEGRIEILGHNMSALNPGERTTLRRDRIGFVFQQFHLIRGLTACENIGVPLVLRGTSPQIVRRRALDLLEAVGLADKAGAHSHNLSAGQCQRVALARALANDPDLILADEPTASLDAASGQDMMELLRRLTAEEERTAIVVTHDPRIFSFADQLYWLENGRIVDQRGSPAGRQQPPPGIILVETPSLFGGSSSLVGVGG